MGFSIKQRLAEQGVHPTDEYLTKIEAKWQEIAALKDDLGTVASPARTADADIALRNIPGGDHIG